MSGPGGWRRPPTWPAAGRHRTPATAPAPTPTPQPVVLADGRHPVFLKTVDPAGRSITFDLIQLSFGAEITIPLAAGLTLLMAGVMALPTQADAASTASPPPVPLGTHSFGHLARTDAIVAEAGPAEVGCTSRKREPPTPVDLRGGADGSIWLLDGGQPPAAGLVAGPTQPPARTVALPFKAAVDLALRPGVGPSPRTSMRWCCGRRSRWLPSGPCPRSGSGWRPRR